MVTYQRSRQSSDGSTGVLSRVTMADCLTLGNGLCGLLVVATALGRLGGVGHGHAGGLSQRQLVLCTALIMAGSICDFADGAVARWRGSSGMGDVLDCMSDALTFGVAPAVVVIASRAGDPDPWRMLVVPVAGAFVIASMLRLARHSTFPAPPGGGFCGLAMPSAAGAVMALVLLHPASVVLLAGVVIIGTLMVSELHYPHQNRRTLPLISVYWLVLASGLVGLVPIRPIALVSLATVALLPLVESLSSHWHARHAPASVSTPLHSDNNARLSV